MKKDGKVHEVVPRKKTKLVGGLEGTSCEEQLRNLGLSLGCSQKRKLKGDPTALCSFLKKGRAPAGAELSSL